MMSEQTGESLTPAQAELLKIRFDYAWKYFDASTRKRMLFFNYFLVIVGILASVLGLATRNGMTFLATFVCLLGFVASLAFISFDVRTRRFASLGEDALERLEREYLFPNGYVLKLEEGGSQQLGFLRRERDERRMREGQKFSIKRLLLKHKCWIRGIEGLAALGFLLGIFATLAR